MANAEETRWIEERAKALGFHLYGVAPAADFEELAHLPEWLARGHAGEMIYLHDGRRGSPASLLPGVRSSIVCALHYNTALPYSTQAAAGAAANDEQPRGWISRYAWGDDYHDVLLAKLEGLVAALRERFTRPFEARAYVDTGAVLERVAAKHAGLGWLAKNTCLINEQLGSWLFLGVILTTLELAPSLGPADAPPPDLCGNCRLCIEACPTGAIVEPYVLDARRCISYLTIELRGSIPEELREPMGRHVFGCDICQDVCPWNRTAPETSEPRFRPRETGGHSLFKPELEWLASLDEQAFQRVFSRSAVKRTKWRGLVRNACVALGNSRLRPGDPAFARILARLESLAASRDPVIAEHARWALARLQDARSERAASRP